MPKNILVTGAKGQVGSELQVLVENNTHLLDKVNFYFTHRDSLDITNTQALRDFIKFHTIDTILNCAAYTAVDKAEIEQDLAYDINTKAVEILASLSLEYGIQLIHISTDYVFNQETNTPLSETDNTNPQGIYAQSKFDGEKKMREINPPNSLIIRTSWVYSSFGNNFVKTMLRLGESRDTLSVVADQIGTPTHARDLAKTILSILAQEYKSETVGLYNYSNEGICSWAEFARTIFRLKGINCEVNPIPTSEYPTPAKRPLYSVLDKKKIKEEFNLEIPEWKDSLETCFKVSSPAPTK